METPNPEPEVPRRRDFRALYWVVAAAMAITVVLEFTGGRPDYMKVAGRSALLLATVLLATARPAETRAKKWLIYGLVAVALGLLLARLLDGTGSGTGG